MHNFDAELHNADTIKTITNNDPLISIGCQTLIVMLLLQEVHNQTISSRRCATALYDNPTVIKHEDEIRLGLLLTGEITEYK